MYASVHGSGGQGGSHNDQEHGQHVHRHQGVCNTGMKGMQHRHQGVCKTGMKGVCNTGMKGVCNTGMKGVRHRHERCATPA